MNRLKQYLTLLVAVSFFYATAQAESENLRQAEKLFAQSQQGDESATEEAYELFLQLRQQQPDDPLMLAYVGSVETLKGRDAWMPWNKLKWVEKGLESVTEAIDMLSDGAIPQEQINNNMRTRLIAIATYVAVPDFLNRFQSGKDLYQATTALPEFQRIAKPFQAQFLIQGAKIAEKEERHTDEKQLLEKALAQGIGGAQAEQAKARLVDLAAE